MICVLVCRTDAHVCIGVARARQGDGAPCGVAAEMAATVTVQIDLIGGRTIPGVWPERGVFIMAVGSARPMEDAARMGCRDPIRRMVTDQGFDETEARFLCPQAGCVRQGNMADPGDSPGAPMARAYLR